VWCRRYEALFPIAQSVWDWAQTDKCRLVCLTADVDPEPCLPCDLTTRVMCDVCARLTNSAPIADLASMEDVMGAPLGTPSPQLVQSAAQTQRQIHQIQQIVRHLLLRIDSVKCSCWLCRAHGQTEVVHAQSRGCDLRKTVCLRCCSQGHWAARCPLQGVSFERFCFVCGFPDCVLNNIRVHPGTCSRTQRQTDTAATVVWMVCNSAPIFEKFQPSTSSTENT
jgi:hypothetical protein